MNSILFLIMMSWCFYILIKINPTIKKEKSYKDPDFYKNDYSSEDYGSMFVMPKEDLSKKEILTDDLFIEIKTLIDLNFHSELVKAKLLSDLKQIEQNENKIEVLKSLELIIEELNRLKKKSETDSLNKNTESILKTIQLIKDNNV